MNILVTAGPAYEPLDQVRRITNHSTGSLGSFLADQFHTAGHQVTCLLGSGAGFQPGNGIRCLEFSTNDSLLDLLKQESGSRSYDAILHAAALSDYRVNKVENSEGVSFKNQKIPSREGRLIVHLEPAAKVLPLLHPLFPKALVVGWKFEVDGSRDEVIKKGRRQLAEAADHAVVLNGPAWGEGFGFLQNNKDPESLYSTKDLFQRLAVFLQTNSA